MLLSRDVLSQWFYEAGQTKVGPMSFADLRAAARSGLLHASTMVWVRGMADWKRADETALKAVLQGPVRDREWVVNRGLCLLRPTQAFLAWLNVHLPPGDRKSLEALRADPLVVLVSLIDKRPNKAVLGDILGEQLGRVGLDPECRPEKPAEEVFQSWFEVELHDRVLDGALDPLKREK